MLRASSINKDGGENIEAVTNDAKIEESPVPSAKQLMNFADAVIERKPDEIMVARKDLQNAIGTAGLIDAAGVVGNFERMNRIADAGGIELDGVLKILSADIRSDLGLNSLDTEGQTKPAGAVAKMTARILLPIAARFLAAKTK